MGGKAGSKKSSTKAAPGISAPVAALHAAGLFARLDPAHFDGDDGGRKSALIRMVEQYLRGDNDEPVLHAPQSAGDLWSVVETKRVLLADPDSRYLHVVEHGETTTYVPKTFNEWIGVYHEALRVLGDERRFVSIDVEDPEEPLYLLVTDAQRAVLQEYDLLAYDWNETDLPDTMTSEERAEDLVRLLGYKHVIATADEGEVVLDLDLDELCALVARLRADVHHDVRVGAYVKIAYADKEDT